MSVVNFPTKNENLIAIYKDLAELHYALNQFSSMLREHPFGHHFDSVYQLLVNRHYDLCLKLQESLPLEHSDKSL